MGRWLAEDILSEEKPDETGDNMETSPMELLVPLAEQMHVSALRAQIATKPQHLNMRKITVVHKF